MLLSILVCYNSNAQVQGYKRIDSLITANQNYKNADTIKVNILSQISFEYYRTDPKKGIEYAQTCILLAKDLKFKKGLAEGYRCIGINYAVMSDYAKALENLFLAGKTYDELGDKRGIAKVNNAVGSVYKSLKNYPKAIEYYFKALKIHQDDNNYKDMTVCLGNIANVYNIMTDYGQALEYYFKALKYTEITGEKSNQATILGNLGTLYLVQKDYTNALKYHYQSLRINKELNNLAGSMFNYGTIGTIYSKLSEDSAFVKENSLKSMTKNDRNLMLNKAKENLLLAIDIAKRIKYENELGSWYGFLAKIFKNLKLWDKAYYYTDLKLQLNDKVFSADTKNRIESIELKSEKELHAKEMKIKQLELKSQQNILIFASGALVLISMLLFFIYTRFRLKKKTAKELEIKNNFINEQKNKIDLAYLNVKMLSEIGQKITSNLTAESISNTVYDNISMLMNSTVFAIGIYNPQNNRIEFTGGKESGETLPYFYYELSDLNRLAVYCFINQKELIISDYMKDSTLYLKKIPEPKVGKFTESLLYLPLNTISKKIGVITVQSFEKNAYTEYHLDILKNLSIYTAIALDNAEAYKKIENQKMEIEQKIKFLEIQRNQIFRKNEQLNELNESKDKYLITLKSELVIAANYVKSIIPAPLNSEEVKANWIYIPSFEVGGDSLSYHWIDNNNFAFYLFDVSGHGIGATLHSVSVLNNLKNQTLPDANFLSPKDVLRKLNSIYQMKKHNNMFFTIWYGVYNITSGMLTWAAAGHPCALYIMSDGSFSHLHRNNPIIGGFKDFEFIESNLEISGKSNLYIYSDGVYEILMPDRTMWEQNQLDEYLCNNYKFSSTSDIDNLYNHVINLRGSNHLDDDFSILKLEFNN